MTELEAQYLGSLDQIRRQISKETAKELLKLLDNLFLFKPVRLRWFVAKAEALMALGRWGEAEEVLFGKYLPLYEDADAYDYCAACVRVYAHNKKRVDELVFRCLLTHLAAQGQGPRGEKAAARKTLEKWDAQIAKAQSAFAEDPQQPQAAAALAEGYRRAGRYVEDLVLTTLCERLQGVGPDKSFCLQALVPRHTNYGYLYERLLSPQPGVFLLLAAKEADVAHCETLGLAIGLMGHTAYVLVPPVPCEAPPGVSPADTVPITLENVEDYGNVKILRPVRLAAEGAPGEDNLSALILHLARQAPGGMAVVLCPGRQMEALCARSSLKKEVQRLTAFDAACFEGYYAMGRAGRYTTYIGGIYRIDVEEALAKPATCAFSIVVPARNSAFTLRHTLQTCLRQRLDDYEIVVSDNSTTGTQVRDLCQELGDQKIRYYKTPRDLSLTRSFEYAFLQARGEFVFAIGSDDAVLPWGLSTLRDVLPKVPEADVLQWDRGFYAWPGFNGPQDGQFNIPRAYRRGEITVQRISGAELLAQTLQKPDFMYGTLPMLYINSGYRRRYLQRLLEKTGRLWDGMSQDLYMGMVNLLLNQEIPYITYPLTLAGMSASSIGATFNTGLRSQDAVSKMGGELQKNNNMGGWVPCALERLCPIVQSDTSGLYSSVLRAASIGLLEEESVRGLNWERAFAEMLAKESLCNLLFDRNAGCFLHAAAQHGGKVEEALCQQLLPTARTPREIPQPPPAPDAPRCYAEGFTADGGLTLDARKFGVTNVAEAVALFEKISNL